MYFVEEEVKKKAFFHSLCPRYLNIRSFQLSFGTYLNFYVSLLFCALYSWEWILSFLVEAQ